METTYWKPGASRRERSAREHGGKWVANAPRTRDRRETDRRAAIARSLADHTDGVAYWRPAYPRP